MINWKKLTHSKCPGCKRHGLPALKTGRRFSSDTVYCKHCGRGYATNMGINIIVELGSLALLFWANFKWIEPHVSEPARQGIFFVLFLLWLILCYGYEYFAPLHEREE